MRVRKVVGWVQRPAGVSGEWYVVVWVWKRVSNVLSSQHQEGSVDLVLSHPALPNSPRHTAPPSNSIPTFFLVVNLP